MTFLQDVCGDAFRRLFGRNVSDIGAGSSSSTPLGSDTDAEPARTGNVSVCGIGDKPVLAGEVTWKPNTPSKWCYAEGSAPTPPPMQRQHRSEWQPSAVHAHRLLSALIQWDYGGQELLYGQIEVLHHVLCGRLGWEVAPWNPVGAKLKRLLGGDKTYRWLPFNDGKRRRLRVYRIPREVPAQAATNLYRAPRVAEARSAA